MRSSTTSSAVWQDGRPKPEYWPADLSTSSARTSCRRAHAVYWPIMLHAAGIEPPRALLVHGWWSVNGQKMSKSTGNYVEPGEYVTKFGVTRCAIF